MCNELLAQSQPSSNVLTMNPTYAFPLLLRYNKTNSAPTVPSSKSHVHFWSFKLIQAPWNTSWHKVFFLFFYNSHELIISPKPKRNTTPCRISATDCSTYLLLLHIWQAVSSVSSIRMCHAVATRDPLNLLKTKRRLLYLKTNSVPRSKHFPSRLQKPIS